MKSKSSSDYGLTYHKDFSVKINGKVFSYKPRDNKARTVIESRRAESLFFNLIEAAFGIKQI